MDRTNPIGETKLTQKGIYESFVPWATGEWSFQNSAAAKADFEEKYARTPVRELISTTSGVALRQSVAARAGFQMITNVDLRQIARLEQCPEAGGLVYHFQKVAVTTAMSNGAYVPGTNLTSVDPTLADQYATVQLYPAASFLQDLELRQAAVNFVEIYGAAQGNALNWQVNSAIWTELCNATTNVVKEIGSGYSKNYSWADIQACVGKIKAQRGKPNKLVTYPYQAACGTTGLVDTGFEPFVLSNITSVQFYGGLAELLKTGTPVALMGMDVYSDYICTPTTACSDGAVMAAVLQGNEAIGWAQATDVETKIQRWELQVGEYMVSNIAGATKLIIEPFVALIEHTNS